MGLFEVLLLSVGLAMDAFAVSICKGLAVKKVTMRESLICGIWFGLFQGLMPLLGYLAGSYFERWINIVAPWVAFILLSFIGSNMIREAFSEEEEEKADFDAKEMFSLAIATSIDALAVGITFVAVPVGILSAGRLQNTILAVVLIGIITFFISGLGVRIGNIFGTRYRAGSEAAGGMILIFIGLRSLIGSLDQMGAVSDIDSVFGMLIPFLGTLIGSSLIFSKQKVSDKMLKMLGSLSALIMLGTAIGGMILPAYKGLGGKTLTIVLCVLTGVLFQFLIDHLIPHSHVLKRKKERDEMSILLGEIIHHIPEGIALGAVFAGHFLEEEWISAAFLLAAALALQNIPEALLVSSPVKEQGSGTGRSFLLGVLSGIPVPLFGIFTLLGTVLFPAALPYIMSAVGGAILYAAFEDIPQEKK